MGCSGNVKHFSNALHGTHCSTFAISYRIVHHVADDNYFDLEMKNNFNFPQSYIQPNEGLALPSSRLATPISEAILSFQ